MPLPIRIGISACLLGERVRYDGSHKRDAYITDLLGKHFTWVPVCPEVEVGMGTPREAVRLVGTADSPRMLGTRTGTDWTTRMQTLARARVAALKTQALDGYILKARSPSCGLRVKVYTDAGMPNHAAPGLFARELQRQCPTLPVEDEGRLNDPALRETFIVRVFAHARWRDFRAAPPLRVSAVSPPSRPLIARLVAFHAAHKLLLMAHSEKHMRSLGRLVAAARTHTAADLLTAYEAGFFEALAVPASRTRHVNALQHIAGYFRDNLSDDARRELTAVIDAYHRGELPLIVPITLIRHHLLTNPHPYLATQHYLNPHPQELMLLNHV